MNYLRPDAMSLWSSDRDEGAGPMMAAKAGTRAATANVCRYGEGHGSTKSKVLHS